MYRQVLIIFLVSFSSLLGFSQQHEETHQSEQEEAQATASHDAHAASGHGESGDWSPTPTIMHHIADANELRLVGNWVMPLPVMIYNQDHKSWFFGNSKQFAADAHGNGNNIVNGYEMVQSRVVPTDHSKYIDFSITKNVFWMIVASLLLYFMFRAVAKAYKQRPNQAPNGLQALIEPIVDFVRDDIAKPFLGKKTNKFLPYLTAVFFFIWLLNLIGLVGPFGNPNISGNIAVTAALTAFTFFIILFSANKQYWEHIFWPPGIPAWVKPILVPVEILGIFTRPFALLIRLFANITAGHILLLSLISLIFIFGKAGQSIPGTIVGVAISVPFTIFIFLIELLVAALQAFIFTMLSAVFIGQAVEDPH